MRALAPPPRAAPSCFGDVDDAGAVDNEIRIRYFCVKLRARRRSGSGL